LTGGTAGRGEVAEAGQLRLPGTGQQDVRGLHVAVQDPVPSGDVEGSGDLDRDAQRVRDREPPALPARLQVTAGAVVHDHEAAVVVGDADRVQRQHVRMGGELGDLLGLPCERVLRLGAEPVVPDLHHGVYLLLLPLVEKDLGGAAHADQPAIPESRNRRWLMVGAGHGPQS